MPKTLNIAVIGAGTMAQAVHLPVLRRRWDRFSIAALVDHSPRRRPGVLRGLGHRGGETLRDRR